jgi:hypothetical protein
MKGRGQNGNGSAFRVRSGFKIVRYWRVTVGALAVGPVKHFPALRTPALAILLFYPLFSPMLFQVFQLFDQSGMMRNAIHNVNIQKIMEALAGKIPAFKAPGYLFFLGAPAKTMTAVFAGGVHSIG